MRNAGDSWRGSYTDRANNRNLEVRVRRAIGLWIVGVASVGMSLGTARAAQEQPPAAPTPTQETTAPSTAAPTPESQDKVPSMPGYRQGQAQPANQDQRQTSPSQTQSGGQDQGQPKGGTVPTGAEQGAPEAMPKPEKAPPPVVTPEEPTAQTPYTAMPPYSPKGTEATRVTEARVRAHGDELGSTYIPVDSWVYPAMMRLYSLGYLDAMNLAMRPYTRRSALHMLQASEDAILSSDDDQAKEILASLLDELTDEGITSDKLATTERGTVYGVQSVYTRLQGISGPILTDSFHLGQTFYNDYGRPHETGFNNVTGFSTIAEQGPFSLYVRGEYQHAPGATGYSPALSATISALDQIPYSGYNLHQATIPSGPIAAQNPFRLVEAAFSYHIVGHEISIGKSDAWLGPAMGGGMAWSNNAENIYSFRINRIEPLKIPLLSRLLGPVRYDFFYGSLKGHTYPNDDYVHSEMFSFQPTKDFQFAFQRTIVFGGHGHEPVTLHTFLKGFFSLNDTTQSL